MKEGTTARFELELSHENIPVTWYKNDVKIHPSRTVVTHVDGKKHVLEIKEVTLDDTCQIKAEAKGIPSMANLTVIGKTRKTTCPLYVLCPVCLLLLHSCVYNVSMFVSVQVHNQHYCVLVRHCCLCFFVRNTFSMLCICVHRLVCLVICLSWTIYILCVLYEPSRVTQTFPHSRGRCILHS